MKTPALRLAIVASALVSVFAFGTADAGRYSDKKNSDLINSQLPQAATGTGTVDFIRADTQTRQQTYTTQASSNLAPRQDASTLGGKLAYVNPYGNYYAKQIMDDLRLAMYMAGAAKAIYSDPARVPSPNGNIRQDLQAITCKLAMDVIYVNGAVTSYETSTGNCLYGKNAQGQCITKGFSVQTYDPNNKKFVAYTDSAINASLSYSDGSGALTFAPSSGDMDLASHVDACSTSYYRPSCPAGQTLVQNPWPYNTYTCQSTGCSTPSSNNLTNLNIYDPNACTAVDYSG